MNRNTVIVDGTLASASTPCSASASDQNSLNGDGRNGILVWKAGGVSIDNLTVCNFIAGTGNAGNEIWWNGGAGSATSDPGVHGELPHRHIHLFRRQRPHQSQRLCHVRPLRIFSSDASGPAVLSNLDANNFSDSGMYVGACKRACGATISHAWMEDNALGYSGTNSVARSSSRTRSSIRTRTGSIPTPH